MVTAGMVTAGTVTAGTVTAGIVTAGTVTSGTSTAGAATTGAGAAAACTPCNLALIVGAENVNPDAENLKKPFSRVNDVVACFAAPFVSTTLKLEVISVPVNPNQQWATSALTSKL